MADAKVEKALYGPSLFEVALGAVLGLVFGVLVACVMLLFRPQMSVRELPKEPAKGAVYYIAGSADSGRARGWQAKEQQLASGAAVTVNEAELNAWAGARSATPKGDDKETRFLSASGLNFRLTENQLQIALVVRFDYFGVAKDFTLLTRGGFARSGDGFSFVPEQFYLGSCPVHLIPGVSSTLMRSLFSKQSLPDEVRSAWAKVTAVAVEGEMLSIATQP